MTKLKNYEKVITQLTWGIIIVFIMKMLIVNNITLLSRSKEFFTEIIIFTLLLIILNFSKNICLSKETIYNEKIFIVFRVSEIFISTVLISLLQDEILVYLIFILSIAFSCYIGSKLTYSLLGFSMGLKLIMESIMIIIYGHEIVYNHLVSYIFEVISVYLGYLLMCSIIIAIYKNNKKNEEDNEKMVVELGEKYEQIAVAKEEIKSQYEKLRDTNQRLEESNKKLTSSIAEFYTLQQISEAIGSIFDPEELLKFVNDVIMGVMGVNYCTIIVNDTRRNLLKVQFTNIVNKEEYAILTDNINCCTIYDVLNNEKPILENNANPQKYEFIGNREVGSFICIPLSSKSRKFGVVLIEHKYQNTFDIENLRLLITIGKQVSMAIENAELYANLQEVANTDGLTQVNNRVYFHEKIIKDFNQAKEEGYYLSLAICDIDFFKKFNDTYGHLFGDVVLKTVAQTIKSSIRSTDTVARFGGEEFVVIMPRTNLNEAFEKVESLRKMIETTVVNDNLISASVTASFGVACYPENSMTQHELIKHADKALYTAKESGRNCVKVYSN